MDRAAMAPEAATTTPPPAASAVLLLAEVVDYAGLFPPAALPMAAAVEEYGVARSGPDAWMLGRFVLPAGRIDEFAAARGSRPGGDAWRLSALVRDRVEADAAAVRELNAAEPRLAFVDAVECRPQSPEGVDWLADTFRRDHLDVYVEIAPGAHAARWLERVAARGLRAKVRTGGVTPDAIPAPSALLAFIEPAVRLRVPFKATAGLHHAVRGVHALTGDAAAPRAAMYGYLNVLLATAALRAGQPVTVAEELLERTDAAAIAFADDAVRWGDVELPAAVLRGTREQQFVSFGSCSFREPAAEFHTISSR